MDNFNIQTAGRRGPALFQDVWLLEKLAHFDREVTLAPDGEFSATKAELAKLLRNWAEALLASGPPDRHQFYQIAEAIKRVANPSFIDVVVRMLAVEKSSWSARTKSMATRRTGAADGSSAYYGRVYGDLFAAMGGAETKSFLVSQLSDEYFNAEAAMALRKIWSHEVGSYPEAGRGAGHWLDFATAKANASIGTRATAEVEAIFSAAKAIFLLSDPALLTRAAELAGIASLMCRDVEIDLIDALFASELNVHVRLQLQVQTFLGGRRPKAVEVAEGVRKTLDISKNALRQLEQEPFRLEQWLEFFSPHIVGQKTSPNPTERLDLHLAFGSH